MTGRDGGGSTFFKAGGLYGFPMSDHGFLS